MKFILMNGKLVVEEEIKKQFEQETPWWDLKGQIVDAIKDAIIELLNDLKSFVLDVIDYITLIGCSSLIILAVSGSQRAKKWAGVLFVSRIIVKVILGGY